jgi:sulfate adenylyltransferase subunit 1 (EFTu-like GTPase family)
MRARDAHRDAAAQLHRLCIRRVARRDKMDLVDYSSSVFIRIEREYEFARASA